MDTNLSPQLRLVAVFGMLVIVLGAGMFMLGRQDQTTAPAPPLPVQHAPATTGAAPCGGALALDDPGEQAAGDQPRADCDPRVADGGRENLKRYRVVSLVTPGVDVDRLARDGAAAAAGSIRAGFVSLNVFRQANGAPLLKKLGLVEAPAVLAITRAARIFAQLERADRDTVEQAVASAWR